MPLTLSTSQVVKIAFAQLGLDPVSSFADDSPQARDAADLYPEALATVLEGTDWTFASRLTVMNAALPEDPPADPRHPYSYALPPDLLTARRVTDQSDANVRWRRDAGLIRSDAPGPLILRYTARVTDESLFPALVRQVVALQLAVLLAPRHAGDTPARKDRLLRDHEAALLEARRQDAAQAATVRWDEPEDDWVSEARR